MNSIFAQVTSILTNHASIQVSAQLKTFELLGQTALIMAVDQDDKYRKGYVNLTKYMSDFYQLNPQEPVKDVRDWQLKAEGKQTIARLFTGSNVPHSIILRKSNETIKDQQLQTEDKSHLTGTYFHPDIVLVVLSWASQKLVYRIQTLTWSSVIVENVVNRQVDDLCTMYSYYKEHNALTMEICQQLRDKLKALKPQVPITYIDKYIELYEQLIEQIMLLAVDLKRVTIKQQIPITITQIPLKYNKIVDKSADKGKAAEERKKQQIKQAKKLLKNNMKRLHQNTEPNQQSGTNQQPSEFCQQCNQTVVNKESHNHCICMNCKSNYGKRNNKQICWKCSH